MGLAEVPRPVLSVYGIPRCKRMSFPVAAWGRLSIYPYLYETDAAGNDTGKIGLAMKKILLVFLYVWIGGDLLAGDAERIERRTFLYAVKGTDSLYLDRYDDPSRPGVKPCVVFMFGGGFWTGWRGAEGYVPFYRFLVQQGYVVIAPDYRLGMKEVREKPLGLSADGFGTLFLRAQNMATEDLFDATRYVLDHAGAWGIDTGMVVVSGSSAGAITALNGVYRLCNRDPVAEHLPENFDYAGVMAFAGAVFDEGAELQWARNPCPILMFHGDADEAVPYDGERVGRFCYYGSEAIAGQLRQMGSPYCFYSAENRNHEMAGLPMTEHRAVILDFLRRFVAEKRSLMIDADEVCTDCLQMRKDYSWKDYIETCFGPVLGPDTGL